MTTETNENNGNRLYAELGEIGNRVRYIQRRVGEIGSQLDEHYRMLRGICDAVESEPEPEWTNLYEVGDEELI